MLRVWNVTLVILTFFLTIFGTFLTRSGMIASVHSFARSSIGITRSAYSAWRAAARIAKMPSAVQNPLIATDRASSLPAALASTGAMPKSSCPGKQNARQLSMSSTTASPACGSGSSRSSPTTRASLSSSPTKS